MSSIVYSTNSKTGNVFAYETYSQRDPITHKVTTKKKYLGRVSPDTGEIIPKGENGKRNRQPSTKQVELATNKEREKTDQLSQSIELLQDKIEQMEKKDAKQEEFIHVILKAALEYNAYLNGESEE